jgi:hypothetical protein
LIIRTNNLSVLHSYNLVLKLVTKSLDLCEMIPDYKSQRKSVIT